MSEETTNIKLPHMSTNQAQKETTYNEAIDKVDFFVARKILAFVSALPSSPSEGDGYILTTNNNIAHYLNGAWEYYTPADGMDFLCVADQKKYIYKNSAWAEYTPSIEGVQVNGTDLAVTAKKVNVDLANATVKNATGVSQLLLRSTAYAIGDIKYSPSLPSNLYLVCTTAGTTGTTEPDFTNVSGGAVVADGSVTFAIKDKLCPFGTGQLFYWPSTTALPSHYYGVKANGATVDVVNDYPLLADYFADGVLPNFIDKFVEGGNTAGTEIGAGLPNITGGITWYGNRNGCPNGSSGAMVSGTRADGLINSLADSVSGYNLISNVDFAASVCNAIYGNSTTVQPPARTAIPYICYA